MSSALRRALVASIIVGGSTAIAIVATVKPAPQANPLIHTAHFATSPVAVRTHHRMAPARRLLSGIGSWYGDLFDGHATASGEIFDQGALTACHPTLPFGTLVRVINLRNRRSVVVRINDRGVRPDRIIDLSSAAAEKIGMLDTGIAPVRLEVLPRDRT